MRDLRGEELEEAVELLDVASRLGNERRRVGLRGLERAYFELEPVAKPLDPPEHANRVSLSEALVEQIDVVPDACVDPSARVHELEREIRIPTTRSQALLACDGEQAIDHAILGELGDHEAILGPRTDGNVPRRAAFEAVSGASLRPWNGGAAGCGRLASPRRRHARPARGSRYREPVQRGAPPRSGVPRGGSQADRRLAGRGGARPRDGAGGLAPRRDLPGSGRGNAEAARFGRACRAIAVLGGQGTSPR